MMKLSSGGELEASVDRKIVKDREGFGVVLQSPIALCFVSVSLCLCKFIVCGKKVCSFLVSSYIVAVEENVRQPQVFFPWMLLLVQKFREEGVCKGEVQL
jgi:hypothetical protein